MQSPKRELVDVKMESEDQNGVPEDNSEENERIKAITKLTFYWTKGAAHLNKFCEYTTCPSLPLLIIMTNNRFNHSK